VPEALTVFFASRRFVGSLQRVLEIDRSMPTVAENRADFESPKFPLKSKAQISDGPGGRLFVMRGKRFSY
jgi:hypothetical protein